MPKLIDNNAGFFSEKLDKQGKPMLPIGIKGRIDYTGLGLKRLEFAASDDQVFVANETAYKKLFLDTLTDLMREQGRQEDAAELFKRYHDLNVTLGQISTLHDKHYYSAMGSQSLLVLRNFETYPANEKETIHEAPESTTHYPFLFSFIEKEKDGKSFMEPIFYMDTKPWSVLKKFGVMEVQQELYCEDFLRMASMAEHDYLHQLISLPSGHSQTKFPDQHDDALRGGPTGSQQETHALSLHAQICDRLFNEVKNGQPIGARRKAAVLGWAKQQMEMIAEIQNTALENAQTLQDRKAIAEAVTYLTEIYGHRLFRVFSPQDPDLYAAIGEPLEKITLAEPLVRLLRPHREEPKNNLELLERNCSEWLEDTYLHIHKLRDMPMQEKRNNKLKPATLVASPAVVGRIAESAIKAMEEKIKLQGGGASFTEGMSRKAADTGYSSSI